MAFNSADTAAFKNVWVFCEQRQGVMMPTTFELISEGRKLANELGVELCGILLGDNVDGIAAELGEYGADKVYVYNSPLLKDFTTDAYTKVIVEAVEELKPEVLLFGASNIGRDLAPRCAARLHTGLCADCTHLDIDMPNYKGFLKEASTLPEERIEKLGTVKIAKAIKISRKCIRIVHENIVFSLGVKLLCLLLVALGFANMWMGIFADVGVMVLAVLNAIRALRVHDL